MLCLTLHMFKILRNQEFLKSSPLGKRRDDGEHLNSSVSPDVKPGAQGARDSPVSGLTEALCPTAKTLLPKLFVHNCFLNAKSGKCIQNRMWLLATPAVSTVGDGRSPTGQVPHAAKGTCCSSKDSRPKLQEEQKPGGCLDPQPAWLWQEGTLISVYLEICGRIYLPGSLGPLPLHPWVGARSQGGQRTVT